MDVIYKQVFEADDPVNEFRRILSMVVGRYHSFRDNYKKVAANDDGVKLVGILNPDGWVELHKEDGEN